MGQKWGIWPLLVEGELGPHLTQRRLGRDYKWHLNSSSSLATTDMGRKLGAVPLLGRGPCLYLTQYGLDRNLPIRAKFHFDPSNGLATIHQRY